MKTLIELTKKLSDATLYCENAYFDDDETFGPSDSVGFTISFLKAQAVYDLTYAAYRLAYDSANDNDRALSDAFTAADAAAVVSAEATVAYTAAWSAYNAAYAKAANAAADAERK